MNSKQNIEDVFRQGFDDFQMKPSGKVWNGINKQMAGPRLEASYKNAFEGFRINPSEQIWRRVAAAIWFQRFIHFTPFSFNVYYLAILTTAIIGTVAVINNSPDLEFVDFDENKYLVQNSDSLQIEDKQIASFNELINISVVENEIAGFVEKQNPESDSENTNVFPEVVLNNNQNETKNQNVVASNSVLISTSKSLENTSNINSQNPDAVSLANNTQTESSINIAEDKNINNSGISNQIKPNLDLSLSKVFIKNSKLLTYKPQWFEKADKAFAGIPEYEVIVKDTIGYNYKGEPVVVDKSWFEAGLYYSPYLFDVKTKTLNQELLSNNLMYNKGVQPELSWSAGLSLSYNYNRFRIESGVLFGRQSESFSQMIKAYDTLTVYSYNYFENSAWDYDTTMILDLDEYLQGNIVYIPYVDSSRYYFTDSLLVSKQDSVLQDRLLTAESKLSYFGVPIIGGYEFSYGKFIITPKAGVVLGILQNHSGTAYRILDGNIVEVSALDFNKFTLNYYGAINLQYRTGEHFGLFAEPYMSGALISEFKKLNPADRRSTRYGVRLGISYRF
ncbi:MAG: hypothetical protein PHE56_01435 [Bacteroidales bacterium]|nr:hypothetical protein [Bacteroidales bacterium]